MDSYFTSNDFCSCKVEKVHYVSYVCILYSVKYNGDYGYGYGLRIQLIHASCALCPAPLLCLSTSFQVKQTHNVWHMY